jgi:hypothetical protein
MQRHAIPDLDLRTVLAERGLECHLLMARRASPGARLTAEAFPSLLCAELKPLLERAYAPNILTPEHFEYETWAVTLRPPSGEPVACCTMGFRSDFPSFFCVRFEAVEPSLQRTGLGRLLFDCVAIWARFLVFNDVLVQEGIVQSREGFYCVVAYIDVPAEDEEWDSVSDNRCGHGAFLKKIGFVRAQFDFGQVEGEVAFQRDFRAPVEDWPEPPEPPTPRLNSSKN